RPDRGGAFALPSEKNLEQVRREQLEYARQQAAAERNEAPEDQRQPEPRAEAPRAGERRKEKQVPALFGVVGRKAG
ncbi:MAG TPA: hypothetical protein VJO54_13475, partial [Burkholderiales bacterium]|nr:hypothetical protein [Burkholderiales bacterium]